MYDSQQFEDLPAFETAMWMWAVSDPQKFTYRFKKIRQKYAPILFASMPRRGLPQGGCSVSHSEGMRDCDRFNGALLLLKPIVSGEFGKTHLQLRAGSIPRYSMWPCSHSDSCGLLPLHRNETLETIYLTTSPLLRWLRISYSSLYRLSMWAHWRHLL